MDLKAHRTTHPLDFSLTSVNIVFLLLLFFLTAGTLLQDAESSVQAPGTEELPLDRLPRPLLVVNDQGAMFLDGEAVTIEQMLEKARQSAARRPSGAADGVGDALPVLHVMPARALSAKSFLSMVKSIRAAGAWNITLVTVHE